MIRILFFGLSLSGLMAGVGLGAPGSRENPRPVERPSRTVEDLQRRQPGAAKDGVSPVAQDDGRAGADTGPVRSGGADEAAPVHFRVSGAEAYAAAREAGWKFFPKGARGALDGQTTVTEIQPGVVFSLVQGPVMKQRRTQAGWGVISQNTFFLFADARGRAKSLAAGWKVRDLRLSGDAFEWVSRPPTGGSSPSLAIQIAGARSARDSVVRLEALELQGPPGAKDWRAAFASPGH